MRTPRAENRLYLGVQRAERRQRDYQSNLFLWKATLAAFAVILACCIAMQCEPAHAYCADSVPPYCPSGTVMVCSDYSPFPMIGKYVCVPIAR